MNLLNQLLRHDAWTTGQFLDVCAELSDEQLDQEFDMGHRSLRRTFLHVIRNMEVWSSLISESTRPHPEPSNTTPSVAELQHRLGIAAAALAKASHTIVADNRWNETYVDAVDGIEKTFGTSIAHVITHSMHHRAQLLYLMRRVGVKDLPEGDVFSWESAECNS